MNVSSACLRPLDPPPPPPPPPSLRSHVRPLTTPHARRPRTYTGGAQSQKRPDTRGARCGAAISSFGDLTVSGYQRRQPADPTAAAGVLDDRRQLNTTADELSRDLRAPKWGASISLNNARRQNRSDQRRLAIALQRLQRQLATVTKRITDRESEVVDELLERCPRAEKDVIRMFRNQPLVMRRLGLPRGGVADSPEVMVGNVTRSRKVKNDARRRKQPDALPVMASTPPGVVLPPYYGNQLLLTGKCLVRPGVDKPTDQQPATVNPAPPDTSETISVGRRLVSLSTPQMKRGAEEDIASLTTGGDVTTMRNQSDLAIEEVARRHVYSHQIPSMMNRGSRAAQYVADLRRTMFPEWRGPVEEVEPPAVAEPVDQRTAVTLGPLVGTPRMPHSRPVGVSHPPNKDLMRATTIALMPKS